MIVIKGVENKVDNGWLDYLFLIIIISLGFLMLSTIRFNVKSSSYDETGKEFPYISNVEYVKDAVGEYEFDSDDVFLNKESKYFIKFTFNKVLNVSNNAIVRVLFNNGSFIERQLIEGKSSYLIIEGDTSIHYENLVPISIEMINGFIHDEYGHNLNFSLKDATFSNQKLIILNESPKLEASSQEDFYIDNVATIVINTEEKYVDYYCISEDENCINFVKYDSNVVKYEFKADSSKKELFVFVKDKAGNISNCSSVSFNYYSFPKFDFIVEEGSLTNNDSINIKAKFYESEYADIKQYCLVVNDGECIRKDLIDNTIEEHKSLGNQEGKKVIKLIMFNVDDMKFEHKYELFYDKSAPVLDVNITNEDRESNHKDILINFSDNYALNELNEYKYYLSISNVLLEGGTWINYENGSSFRIRNVNDGTYYLWIKTVSDKIGNYYSNNEYFVVDSALMFDNSKPLLNVDYNQDAVDVTSNYCKEFIITYSDDGTIKEMVLDKSYLVVDVNIDVNYEIKIKEILENGWVIEISFSEYNIQSGEFTLTVLSNLIEDEAGNRSDSFTTQIIKIS